MKHKFLHTHAQTVTHMRKQSHTCANNQVSCCCCAMLLRYYLINSCIEAALKSLLYKGSILWYEN